jgi:hypothetical protein
VVLLASLTLPQRAAAQGGGCRTDPVVYLSSGRAVEISAWVSDDRSDVYGAAYTVHVPVGTLVTRVQYTGGVPESVTVYADAASSTYRTETTVTTGATVSVSATSRLSATGQGDGDRRVLDTESVSGVSGQALAVSLNG